MKKLLVFSCLTGDIESPKVIHRKSKNSKWKAFISNEIRRSGVPKKYSEYIKSKYWRQRRDNFYRKYERKCALCGSKFNVKLHHSFYGNFGNEKDEHLVPLCEEHHKQFHEEMGKTKRDMTNETLQFIEDNYDPSLT